MSETDSDEAAAVVTARRLQGARTGVQEEAHLMASKSTIDSYCGSPRARATKKIQLACRMLSRLHPAVPDVVTFGVGGSVFAVGRDILLKDPQSLLFVLANEHYGGREASASCRVPDREHGGNRKRSRELTSHSHDNEQAEGGLISIPNRDPFIFRMLLNLVRGYTNAVPEALVDACRRDAEYYGLQCSWQSQFPRSEWYQFRWPSGGTKMVSDTVCALASSYYASGVHSIDFRISTSERVAVGIVSRTDCVTMETLRHAHGSALYWSDGRVTLQFDTHTTVDTGYPYPQPATIRVVLDADEEIVRWVVNGSCDAAMHRLQSGRSFAFFVVAASNSEINIIPG